MSCNAVTNEEKLSLFFATTEQIVRNDSEDNRRITIYLTSNLELFFKKDENRNLLNGDQSKIVALLRSYRCEADSNNETTLKIRKLILEILESTNRNM